MPAVSEKQRRFFGAVMGAKKGKPGASGAAKETASSMSEEQIKHYLHKKGSAMNEVYAQGFIDKCAAMGVSHELLVKQAFAINPVVAAPAAKGIEAIIQKIMGSGIGRFGRGLVRGVKAFPGDAHAAVTGGRMSNINTVAKDLGNAGRAGVLAGTALPGAGAVAGISSINSKRQDQQHPLATKIKSLAGR